MKIKKKRQRMVIEIIILLFLAFLFVASAVSLLITTLTKATDPTVSAIIFFAIIVCMIVISVLLYVIARRWDAITEEVNFTSEYFATPNTIWTTEKMKRFLASESRGRKKIVGVIGAVGIKDLYGELLSLYGEEVTKNINDLIYQVIESHYKGKGETHYAFNRVNDFLIYCKTDDPSGFYEELGILSKEISMKIEETGSLPGVTALVGGYEIREGDSPEQMLTRAAFAEKHNSSTRLSGDVMVFAKEMMGDTESTRDLSYELSRALDEGQLEVYYQPKYDLNLKKFYGAEALIRWNHPVRGLLPPSLFIPFAEQSGKILDVDRYVFRHVCMDIARWEKEKKRLLKISVNLSRRSVYDPTINAYFLRTMEEYHVNPLLIDMELTESLAAKDTIFISSVIRKLKQEQFDTSIDDFGTGYSSLAALRKIPFDTMKVDKSFIDDIEIDKKARDMVGSVIELGHGLDMKVIAEGVQTSSQVEILRKLHLDAIQGFYFAHPMSAFDYEAFLVKNPFEKGKGESK